MSRYKTLRIDDVPETNDSDEDDDGTLMGRTVYNKREDKSPHTLDEHLTLDQDNMLHFKALAKYYGVASFLVKMPEIVDKATAVKYQIATPDAEVQSISASKMDKHMFIKFLVSQIR